MRTLVLVSRCMKKKIDHYEFHFRGCYEGNVLERVSIRTIKKLEIKEDYIIWLSVEKIEGVTLWGKIQKIRSIKDLKIDL